MSAVHLLIALLAAGHIETSEACKQAMDICFVLDGSTDVCNGSYPCENWNFARQFCSDIANTLDIDANIFSLLGLVELDQVAFVTFTNTTEKIWGLNKYTAKNPLLTAINGVPFKGGVFTDLPSAAIVHTLVFNPVYGDNTLNKNVELMVTSGVPAVSDLQAQAASLAVQVYGVEIFIVCITNQTGTPGCTESWAKAAASTPTKPDLRTYFLVDDYASLPGAMGDVLEQICKYLEDSSGSSPIININLNLTVG